MRDIVRCAHCGCTFDRNARVKNQRYRNNKPCQRARKRLWQKQKLAVDPDYKQNQRDSQKLWSSQNRQYRKDYRRDNVGYTDRNRTLQKIRDTRRLLLKNNLAKMDALVQKVCLIPASYT